MELNKTADTKSSGRKILEVKNLTCVAKSSGVSVVDNVSFSIAHGESIGLLGESGVGKTTLFRAILQLLPQSEWRTEGEILINGKQVVGLLPKELEQVRGRMVRCVFQEPGQSLNPSLKIDRQLIEAVRVISPGLEEESIWKSIIKSLANAGLSDPGLIKGRYPGELSGGQRQRVGIAMSLCCPCSLLLADEPSNSLDSVTVTELVDTLKRLKREEYLESIFCVTHDLSVLGALETGRVLFMHAGKMFEVGNIKEVLANPGHEKLAEMVKLSKTIDRHGSRELGDIEESKKETLVTIKNLEFGFQRKSFLQKKKSLVIKDISLEVKRGEFVALVGSSGSGKSTIGGVLARLLRDFSGDVVFDGMDIAKLRKRGDRVRFHREL
ncbi:ATP-binding cassette domain-containing protein, partial [bacterium]|nr:ATP-binding cassette domain-containing protein [bacterium]